MAEPERMVSDERLAELSAGPKVGRPPGEMLTYLAGEGDPVTIKWRGVEFKANVPQRVADKAHIAAARTNKFFRVGNELKEAPSFAPKDSMDYRAHVIDWMRDVTTVDHLVRNWSADRNLRVKCEVGDDDVRYLGTIIEPRLRTMRQAEGLSDGQVAQIWIDHGILDLPWRA